MKTLCVLACLLATTTIPLQASSSGSSSHARRYLGHFGRHHRPAPRPSHRYYLNPHYRLPYYSNTYYRFLYSSTGVGLCQYIGHNILICIPPQPAQTTTTAPAQTTTAAPAQTTTAAPAQTTIVAPAQTTTATPAQTTTGVPAQTAIATPAVEREPTPISRGDH